MHLYPYPTQKFVGLNLSELTMTHSIDLRPWLR